MNLQFLSYLGALEQAEDAWRMSVERQGKVRKAWEVGTHNKEVWRW